MGKYDELVERFKEHATDWDGQQMPDGEPAKGDPTAGDLRKAATAITTLEAELEKLRPQVKVADDQWDAKCDELAAMKARGDRLAEALITLSELSSYLGAGAGDDTTTVEQFNQRIRWGIDHIGGSYRNRAAQVVEECSKKFGTTWGQVKRAILEDTCLEPATLIRDEARGPEIEEAADRITTLEAELAAMKARGDRLAEALEPFVTGAAYTRIFLQSRERMHPAGQDLYDADVATARQVLTEWRDHHHGGNDADT